MLTFKHVFLNCCSEKCKTNTKVVILIALFSSIVVLYRYLFTPNQTVMSNKPETKATSECNYEEMSDLTVSRDKKAVKNGSPLFNVDSQMNCEERHSNDNIKSNAISDEYCEVATIKEGCDIGEAHEEDGKPNHISGQVNQILSLTEGCNSANKNPGILVVPEGITCCGNEDFEIHNPLSVEPNATLTLRGVDTRSIFLLNDILQGSEEEGTENQVVVKANLSKEEYEDAVGLRNDVLIFHVSKVDSNLSDAGNTIGQEDNDQNFHVTSAFDDAKEHSINSDSDDEFEDAIGVEEWAVKPEGSELHGESVETVGTYIPVRNLSSLAHGHISGTVHLSHDLGKVNNKQNMGMGPQLALPLGTNNIVQETEVELRMLSREEWKAERAMNVLTPLKKPVRLIIVSHTAASPFYTLSENAKEVRDIQRYHMVDQEWDDIGYNFLIGMDGSVFEGRGWDAVGSHTKDYNIFSIEVSFIGKFIFGLPTDAAMQCFHSLMIKGVNLGHIAPDYKLHGACQLRPTLSPGEALYKEIMQWHHWAPVEEKQ